MSTPQPPDSSGADDQPYGSDPTRPGPQYGDGQGGYGQGGYGGQGGYSQGGYDQGGYSQGGYGGQQSGPPSYGPGSGGGWGGDVGGPAPQQPWGGDPSPTSKSFFAKLFDISFRTYITPSVVKVVYVLAIIGCVFGWLLFTAAAFSRSSALGILVLLIIGPLYSLFLLVLTRITLEFYCAVIRIAEDVSVLRGNRR